MHAASRGLQYGLVWQVFFALSRTSFLAEQSSQYFFFTILNARSKSLRLSPHIIYTASPSSTHLQSPKSTHPLLPETYSSTRSDESPNHHPLQSSISQTSHNPSILHIRAVIAPSSQTPYPHKTPETTYANPFPPPQKGKHSLYTSHKPPPPTSPSPSTKPTPNPTTDRIDSVPPASSCSRFRWIGKPTGSAFK